MITRALTSTNDWTFGNGIGNYLTGEAAIEQNIKTKILEWKGDCYYATLEGVDWKNRLGPGQQKNLLTEIKGVALQCFGVTGVLSISGVFNAQNRFMAISLTLTTIFSPSPAVLQITVPIAGVSNGN